MRVLNIEKFVLKMANNGSCRTCSNGQPSSLQVFRQNVEKRIRCLPEIDGLAKETVLNSWMLKFDQICRGGASGTDSDESRRPSSTPGHKQSVSAPPQPPFSACGSPFALVASNAESTPSSKEQLYDMFQQILCVKKYEHQILFNACQVSELLLCSKGGGWLGQNSRLLTVREI